MMNRDPMEGTPLLPLGHKKASIMWAHAEGIPSSMDPVSKIVTACVELGIIPQRTQYQSRYHQKRTYT